MEQQYKEPLVTEESKSPERRKKICQSFKQLANIKDKWQLTVILLIKFFESFAYFIISSIFTLYLYDQFQVSDLDGGVYFATYNFLTAGYGIILGQIIDRMGVKTSLAIAVSLCLTGRLLILFINDEVFFIIVMFSALAIGTSLVLPSLIIAIKRITTPITRPAAFSLFYIFMNIAAMTSGWIIDALRSKYPRNADNSLTGPWWDLGFASFQFNYERAVILTAFSVSLGLIPAVFCCFKSTQNQEELGQNRQNNVLEQFWVVIKEKRFWKFFVFIMLMSFVKKIFRYLDAIFGKYAERVLGPKTPWGTIVSLNPILIIFLVPLATPLSLKLNGYTQILVGSFITGISPFALAISSSIPAAVVFVVVLSIGEAIWSPRLYDYTVSIIEKGKEGIYLGLGTSQLFFSAMLSGLIGGALVEEYCPVEKENQKPELLWAIVGSATIASFVGLIILRPCIELHPIEKQL